MAVSVVQSSQGLLGLTSKPFAPKASEKHRTDSFTYQPRLAAQPRRSQHPGVLIGGAAVGATLKRRAPVAVFTTPLLPSFDASGGALTTEYVQEADVALCPHCQLPTGDFGYEETAGGALVHGECKALMMLRTAKALDEAKQKKDADLKRSRREEFGIGWQAEKMVPSNVAHQAQLKVDMGAHGMCCVVLEDGGSTLRAERTSNPAACINFEYLSLALQVRRQDGREPFFSLDPVDDASQKESTASVRDRMQAKRFEPAWLAGTSVGEIMFQADYHLKELSMGEHEQPVAGMQSCLDLLAGQQGSDKNWRGREWFVVNNAEILLHAGGVLVPHVDMGVQARAQERSADGIGDAVLSREDHPLVRYAETFTKNFDLIAERKSVIFHLRELAKAAVLAKFLVEDAISIDDPWMSLALGAKDAPLMNIPQLWNEQRHSEICVKDGAIVADKRIAQQTHGLYGGVEFGLAAVPRLTARIPPTRTADRPYQIQALAGRAVGRAVTAPRMARLSAAGTPARAALSVGVTTLSAGGARTAPRGVDLNLDQFALEPTVAAKPGTVGVVGTWGAAPTGSAFWNSMDTLEKNDRVLLDALFDPKLSDRRMEGEVFMPPATDAAYVEKLTRLLHDEAAVRQQRRKQFFSKAFLPGSVGPLFPSSWQVHDAVWDATHKDGRLPFQTEVASLETAMRAAEPIFDKRTEDGTRYRIYNVAGLEVRTTQEAAGDETIGVVFSTRRPEASKALTAGATKDREFVTKATQYVERVNETAWGYYLVLETESGHAIVTERKRNGSITWEENPKHLESRNGVAKVVGCAEPTERSVTVGDVRGSQSVYASRGPASGAECRDYVAGAFTLVLPACAKPWCGLVQAQRRAAERLGVHSQEAWDDYAAEVWTISWWDLTEVQRSAARALGFSEASWAPSAETTRKGWEDLTEVERAAAAQLRITDEEAWTKASPDGAQQVLRSVWERAWEQLSDKDKEAAVILGIDGPNAWDDASWKSGGEWERSWESLTRREQKAAKALGLTGAALWEKASEDKLDRHWGVTSWSALSAGQQSTAGRLGYDRASWSA